MKRSRYRVEIRVCCAGFEWARMDARLPLKHTGFQTFCFIRCLQHVHPLFLPGASEPPTLNRVGRGGSSIERMKEIALTTDAREQRQECVVGAGRGAIPDRCRWR